LLPPVKRSVVGLLVGLVFAASTPAAVPAAEPAPSGAIGGVGILMWRKQNGDLAIAQVIADGPAARASLRPGQIIRAINGAPATALTLEDAAKLTRGAAGTKVLLDVSEPDSIEWRKFSLVRQVIVAGLNYRMLDGDIGQLAITSFNDQTPARAKQALDVLAAQGARGLVVDLRYSDGGDSASTQIDVAGYFVGDAAPLWLERTKGEAKATPVHSSQQRVWQRPVVVLGNQKTAGQSVLLAVALRYAGHVRLIGRSTAGVPAAAGVRHFSTPRDEPLASRGMAPDVPLDASVSYPDELTRAVADLARQLPPSGTGH
jgi:carboxyl-terminal processing protease